MGKQAQQLSWKLRRLQKALEGSSPWDFMPSLGMRCPKLRQVMLEKWKRLRNSARADDAVWHSLQQLFCNLKWVKAVQGRHSA